MQRREQMRVEQESMGNPVRLRSFRFVPQSSKLLTGLKWEDRSPLILTSCVHQSDREEMAWRLKPEE